MGGRWLVLPIVVVATTAPTGASDPSSSWSPACPVVQQERQLDCGPDTATHLSDLPAQGLHVFRAVDGGRRCGEGNGALIAKVYVDGAAVADEGDSTPQIEVPCHDSRWQSEDSRLAWVRSVQDLVARKRPALHETLRQSGAITDVALQEMTAKRPESSVARWAFFTPYARTRAQLRVLSPFILQPSETETFGVEQARVASAMAAGADLACAGGLPAAVSYRRRRLHVARNPPGPHDYSTCSGHTQKQKNI